MRWNRKKLTVAGFVVVLLWFFVIYFPFERLKSAPVLSKEMLVEQRLELLEKRLHTQHRDITKLLETVKSYRHKTEALAKDEDVKEVDSDGMPEPEQTPLVLPVLVIACDRVTVKRCLDSLIKYRPDKTMFPIIVSQDCDHDLTYQVIKKFVDEDPSISVIKQPDQSEIPLKKEELKFKGYFKIARHFKFALSYVYETLGYDAAIIVEDDLDISPDFFEYFQGTYPLLRRDPSLWCISAWNDNGKKNLVDIDHPELLHRTDFFPGLGWTMRRETWLKLAPHWPSAYFDDWLRDPANIGSRSCIRPEVSRTYSFGKVGVSRGQFFDMHLRYMQLNKRFIEFSKLDLRYLIKRNYDVALKKALANADTMTANEVMSILPLPPSDTPQEIKVYYSDARTFRKNARKLGLMDEFRSGVPRTAYNGTVSCFIQGHRVYLTPDFEWTHYDPSWGTYNFNEAEVQFGPRLF